MDDETLDLIQALSQSNSKNNRKSVKDRDVRGSDKVNPVLKSNEARRAFNIGTALANAFFTVKKKNEKDTFGATATTPAEKATATATKGAAMKPGKLKLPLLLALGAGITAFATWLADFLGPVGEFITKTLPKILKPMGNVAKGFFTAIKGGKLLATLTGIAGKIGKRLLKFGRFIPVIGSLFSFGFGIARWKKGEYIPAVFEFLSGILNLLPTGVGNIASILIDGALLLYDLNKETGEDKTVAPAGGVDFWGQIKDFALNLPGVQNIINLGKGFGAIFKGDFKGAAEYFNKALPFIGAVIGWLAKAGQSVGKVIENINLPSPGEFFGSIANKFISIFKGMMDKIYGWLTGAADWVVGKVKDFGSGAWEGVKAVGSFLNPFDDVVIKGNKIIPINKKDDIIAAKSGGVIGDIMGSDNVIGEIKTSNIHLSQLVQLTAQLVAGQGQGASASPNVVMQPSNTDMSGGMQGPSYNDGRFDYTNSAYSLTP